MLLLHDFWKSKDLSSEPQNHLIFQNLLFYLLRKWWSKTIFLGLTSLNFLKWDKESMVSEWWSLEFYLHLSELQFLEIFHCKLYTKVHWSNIKWHFYLLLFLCFGSSIFSSNQCELPQSFLCIYKGILECCFKFPLHKDKIGRFLPKFYQPNKWTQNL